jgi:aspartate aminotransferase
MAMTAKARTMRAAGTPVISLTIGEPDFASPPHAIEAAHQAALRGETKYTPQDGIPALKQAIQRKFKRDSDLDFALDEITVSAGGKQVIFNALMATIDEGDEVVIPAPYWGAYPLMTSLVGGVPVPVNCPDNNGFKLRPDDLDAAITPRTKWLMLNFPNNPTGAACSMAAVQPALRDRTLTVSSVSKTYAMTGWRVGFAAGPKPLVKAMVTMQGHATAGVSGITQAAAAAALDGPQESVAIQADAYRRRRDLVVEALNLAPGIRCHRPEGAFYVYPNIAGCLGKTTAGGARIDTDEQFALALLEEQHVALVHGAAFGMSPYLRISYATDDASLTEACARIQTFCAALT